MCIFFCSKSGVFDCKIWSDKCKINVCCFQVVGVETEKVSKEKAIADEEESKVVAIAVVVSGKQRDCEEDLAKAEPALLAARDALNTLNKVSFPLNTFLGHIDLFPNTSIRALFFWGGIHLFFFYFVFKT